MLVVLAGESDRADTPMIDATHLKIRRDASSPGLKKGRGRPIGSTKGRLNSKLHTVADAVGRPILLIVSATLTGDYLSARAFVGGLRATKVLIGDRGYDVDWFRNVLQVTGIPL